MIQDCHIHSSSAYQRDISIDIAKGICIILMVAGHAMPFDGWIAQMMFIFRMPTFFIASGYLFREKNLDTPGKYVKRKVKGLWWPFVFWSLFFLLLHNIFTYCNLYSQGYNLTETLKLIPRYIVMAGTEQLLGGFWFLSALLFATVAGFCYYKWIGFSNRAIIIGVLLMLCCAELLCYFWNKPLYGAFEFSRFYGCSLLLDWYSLCKDKPGFAS